MTTFTKQAAQGDLLITRIDALPDGLSEAVPESGKIVLAHSETGHHHVVPSSAASLFVAANDEGFQAFLVVREDTQITHLRDWDTHEALDVGPGIYQLDKQREYTPEGFRRAAD